MKLLLDENISRRVVTGIRDLYPDSTHVASVGLIGAGDSVVWAYAEEHDLVIVTKDDDFLAMSVRHGHPPKVVLLQIGNCRTGEIVHLLRAHRNELLGFADGDTSLLVLTR